MTRTKEKVVAWIARLVEGEYLELVESGSGQYRFRDRNGWELVLTRREVEPHFRVTEIVADGLRWPEQAIQESLPCIASFRFPSWLLSDQPIG
jgi:hypothetical protein